MLDYKFQKKNSLKIKDLGLHQRREEGKAAKSATEK